MTYGIYLNIPNLAICSDIDYDKAYEHENIILNIDSEEGTHWQAIHHGNIVKVFDSYGLLPDEHVMKVNKQKKNKVKHNNTRYQTKNSTCGIWCLAFLMKENSLITTMPKTERDLLKLFLTYYTDLDIKALYLNTKGGLLSADKLHKNLKYKNNITVSRVKKIISKIEARQWMHESKIRSKNIKYIHHDTPKKNNEIHQIDLMEMIPFTKNGKTYKYTITVIDKRSRLGACIPIAQKTKVNVKNQVEALYKDRKSKLKTPSKLELDKGSEFNDMHKLCKNIRWSETNNKNQQAIVERFQKTIQKRLAIYFDVIAKDNDWVKVLPDVVNTYNTSYHRGIKAKPIDVMNNKAKPFTHPLPKETKKKYNIGDLVRYKARPNQQQNRAMDQQYSLNAALITNYRCVNNIHQYYVEDEGRKPVMAKWMYEHELIPANDTLSTPITNEEVLKIY